MLDWRGRALRDHVVGRMAEISDDVIVLVAHDDAAADRSEAPSGVRYVSDDHEWPGPLLAVAAALDEARHDVALIVAADMPVVPIRVLEMLVARLDGPPGELRDEARDQRGEQGTSSDAAPAPVAGLELDGVIQQLPIAVRRGAITANLRDSIAAGERRLGALARLPGALAVAEPAWRALDANADALRDIDTEDDLHALLREPIDD